MEIVETESIDIQLEHTRNKGDEAERRLFISIEKRGILDPVDVVAIDNEAGQQQYVLLDGFKRYRCAKKLHMTMIPVEHISTDIATGILAVLRRNASRSCGITTIEQAALIEELHNKYSMSINDIALHLDRSPSWVCMRIGMLDELSCLVREKISTGAFPARAYIYALKGFTRVNGIPASIVDECVNALSGKKLGTRDLFILSRAYFSAGTSIKQLISDGDVHRALKILKGRDNSSDSTITNKIEKKCIEELKCVSAGINGLMHNNGKYSESCRGSMEVNLWCAGILNNISSFESVVKELYEKSGHSISRTDNETIGTK
jgi:ParB/RepB/Spo0J family partition protein